jgi:hypothetical protein
MVNVSVRNSCHCDITPVLSNLSTRTSDEVARFLTHLPCSERTTWLSEHVVDAITRKASSTFLAAEQPVGFLTWTQEGKWWYTTSLVTERGFQPDFLRLSRRHIANVQAQLETDVVAYSRSQHEKSEAWFRLMGFQFLRWDGDARLFIRSWPNI